MTDASPASSVSLGLVDRVAALHRVELFAGIPGRVLAAVAEAAVEVRASPGEVLMAEGAVEAHLYALVEGRVRVHRSGQTLVELGPGATVGELAALVPAPRTAWVTALEPTLVLRVDQAVLDDLLVDWPELAHGVIAALVSRLRATAEHAGQGGEQYGPARGRRSTDRAGARIRRDAGAADDHSQLAVPRHLWLGMAAGDIYRDRDRRQRGVGSRRPAARRTRLAQIATVSLGGLAALFAASWVILAAGGAWASAVLLVLFPIALQLGFVFIGGKAGRLLDVRQMKALFPRVVTGFAVGFFLGGLLGIPLLAVLGSTENLLLATTAAQCAFLGLLLVTERRFPEARAAPVVDSPVVVRPPLLKLFASGLALLLLAYQVLSAMGSQVVDFLLFNRAAAHYGGDDLTRFLAGYTAALNLVDVLFLAVLAAPLMRRFGLRLGLS